MSDIEKNEINGTDEERQEENEALASVPQEENEASVSQEDIPLEVQTEETPRTDGKLSADDLEGLRDAVQLVLDETTETFLAGGDIQGFDEVQEEKEEKEIPPEDICECCGEKPRDKSLGENYPYCTECRELMKSYPIGFKGVLTLIIVLALSVASVYFSLSNTELSEKALEADGYASSGKLYSAMYGYYDLLNGATVVPKKVAAKFVKVCASLSDYSDVTTGLENYFTETELKLPPFSSLNKYSVKSATVNAVSDIIRNAISEGKNTKDDVSAVCEQLDELKSGEEKYDEFLIEYYKYIVMHNFGTPFEQKLDFLKSVEERFPDEWVYSVDLCALYGKKGDVENAKKYFDTIISNNSEEATAHVYLADAYRFSEKPDADEMLRVIQDGFTAQGQYENSSCDLYREQALAYLLKGDYEKAFESASKAYETAYTYLAYYGYQINNLYQCLYTYAVCGEAAKDDTAYAAVDSLIPQLGAEMPDSIKAIADGKGDIPSLVTDSEGVLA